MARSPLVIKPECHRDKSGNLVATYIVEEIDPDDQVSAIVVERCTPDESSTGVISPNRNIRVRIMLQDGSCSFKADFPDWGQALSTLRERLNEYGFPECEIEDPML